MITPVSSVAPPLFRVQPAAPTQASPSPKPQPVPSDTVTIGGGASALQEAYETPAQTTLEAAAGDLQARQLLAKEEAAAKAA
jgi:hypothetical protein